MKKRNTYRLDVSGEDFGAVLNCAVRYSIGRKTYMPSVVIGFTSSILNDICDRSLWCFDGDIDEAAKLNNLGDELIDKPLWLLFHDKVKKEINKRKEEGSWTLKT